MNNERHHAFRRVPTHYSLLITHYSALLISTNTSLFPPLLVHAYTFPAGEMQRSRKRPHSSLKYVCVCITARPSVLNLICLMLAFFSVIINNEFFHCGMKSLE